MVVVLSFVIAIGVSVVECSVLSKLLLVAIVVVDIEDMDRCRFKLRLEEKTWNPNILGCCCDSSIVGGGGDGGNDGGDGVLCGGGNDTTSSSVGVVVPVGKLLLVLLSVGVIVSSGFSQRGCSSPSSLWVDNSEWGRFILSIGAVTVYDGAHSFSSP